jgi:CRISPR-associated protein Cst2
MDPQGKGKGKETYIDDDVLGFMHVEAGKAEGNESEASARKGKSKRRAKGRRDKRRGVLEVTRAMSLIPFAGDVTFNAKSGEKTSTSLYGTEIHATRYQYGFTLTPEGLRQKSRALDVVDALISLSEVAGNQSRFLYDFSPDAVIFRWTADFAPRFLYGFEPNGERVSLRGDTLDRIKAHDIDARELVVGGSLAATPDATALSEQGAVVLDGVKAAGEEIKRRMRADLGLT